VYIGRQPIIDKDENTFAYDILYRDSQNKSNITDNRHASATVINSILNKFGRSALLGAYKAFIKIDEKFLMNDIIFSIPKDFFIFSLLESVEINERVIERVEQLFAKEYTLCMNDTALTKERLAECKPILKELSFFKINFQKEIKEETKLLIKELQSHNIQVIATRIEDGIYYDLATRNGCDLFQGYFLAKPNIMENEKCDPSQMGILKLYNLLIQDTNIDEIASEFEKNPALTIQLLQFINSGYYSFKNKISSIHHILTLVGRKPLSQWLMLMVYSKSVSNKNSYSPLMIMAKSRTELMENLLKAIRPDVKSNALGEAYFVGVLSLVDAVFKVDISTVLESMQVNDAVKVALLREEGLLGELYALVKNIEVLNTTAIEAFALKYDLKLSTVQNLILESVESVNRFEASLNA